MIDGFIDEEEGQAALEYILTVGMIIVAVVVLFSIYGKMAKSSIDKMDRTTDAATSAMSSKISSEVVDIA
jgi:uncharacterized protein (UPF0333 family)